MTKIHFFLFNLNLESQIEVYFLLGHPVLTPGVGVGVIIRIKTKLSSTELANLN